MDTALVKYMQKQLQAVALDFKRYMYVLMATSSRCGLLDYCTK